jgi:serine/threonine protein kinase
MLGTGVGLHWIPFVLSLIASPLSISIPPPLPPPRCQGDLFDEMKRSAGRMQEGELLGAVLLPMMGALLHMHQQGFIHRDIKPENTLFAAGRVLKLAGGGSGCGLVSG